jgi:uncharacterized protein
MDDAADDPAIVGPLDTSYICRQVRLDPLPLLIAKPKQRPAHDLIPCDESRHSNQDCLALAAKLLSSDPNSNFVGA